MAAKKLSGVYVSWPKPDFTTCVKSNKNFRSNFNGAMLYVHYEVSVTDLKKAVVKYLKAIDAKHPLLDRIKDMNERRFMTIGKYMYVLNHGCDVTDEIASGMMPALEKIINEEELRQTATEKHNYIADSESVIKSAPSIQDRIKDKAFEVAGEVEGWVDELTSDKKIPVKTVAEFVNLFSSNGLKSPHTKHIQQKFEKSAGEFTAALAGNDAYLNEGYSNFSKAELKKAVTFYTNLFNACVMTHEVAKVARTPTKKKLVSSDTVVAKMKYKRDDKTLGIVSINPTQIIGAKALWCFDTKSRKFVKYVADDMHGPLSVKGTTILGFSEVNSISKTLKKPAEQLALFKKSGKIQLRTFMDDIVTVGIVPSGRINEHTILLRVDK